MIRKRYKDSRYREFEREFDEQFESETNKTEIYLDRSNRNLGGVCAGVARYFNIQPLFVRLGAVVFFSSPSKPCSSPTVSRTSS